ncbi:MAG TPA: SMC-Scp complex subunit ScpB, partial [Planctomycetota bacterium]|nr:SMC-Scp complex subunit ScpB [Planctomycetota bacterium]
MIAPEVPEPAATEEDVPSAAKLPADASEEDVGRAAAALVFASDRPLPLSRLADLLGRPGAAVRTALERFGEKLASIGAPFSTVELAGGYRFVTDPALAPAIAALRGEMKKERLSAAALETLAIVAYRQPVTKGEIEALRGVQAGPILRALLDKRLVRTTGRAPVPGRPLQYGTTKEFLDRFQ